MNLVYIKHTIKTKKSFNGLNPGNKNDRIRVEFIEQQQTEHAKPLTNIPAIASIAGLPKNNHHLTNIIML